LKALESESLLPEPTGTGKMRQYFKRQVEAARSLQAYKKCLFENCSIQRTKGRGTDTQV